MDWISLFLVPAIKSVVLVVILLTGFAYLSYIERKLVARFQVRYGPNRAGPFGSLQPIAACHARRWPRYSCRRRA